MRPIVIGGCPGAGKSSASKELAKLISGCVLIETDDFFSYLVDPIDPSTPAAKSQNETVISAYAESANVYRNGGYTVVLEGVIGPWVFSTLAPILGRFDYFLLHTSLESALNRVSTRSTKQVTLGKVERMHPQFDGVLSNTRDHVINTEHIGPDTVAKMILTKIEEGSCEIRAT